MENMVAAGAEPVVDHLFRRRDRPHRREDQGPGRGGGLHLDSPVDEADALFATDNFKAGELIGADARLRSVARRP